MSSYNDRLNQPVSFDPVGFTVVPPRRFEDLRVGDVFRAPSRTLTEAHASAFQTVSADNHPIHYDEMQGMMDQVVLPRTPGAFRTVFVPRGSSKPQWLHEV